MESNKKRKSPNEINRNISDDDDDDDMESNGPELESMADIELEASIQSKKRIYEVFAIKMPDRGQKINHKIASLQQEKHRREINRLRKAEALEVAMKDTNMWYEKGIVTRLGRAAGVFVETFPSGCLTLDFVLGGGLPRGRVVEIYGPQGSGKTTLALHAIAAVQKLGGNAMLVDAAPFDPTYPQRLGVDIESLIVGQPSNAKMALEIADRMCKSGAIDLICVDSVSALAPRAEQTGLQESRMSEALHKLTGNSFRAGCTLIFLTQKKYCFESSEVTSGVISSKFFASVRLELNPIEEIKSVTDDEHIGVKVRVKVQKSKVSWPSKQAEFEIISGEGVSKLGCILDCAEMMQVVLKKGSFYCYADQRLGQGRDEALQHLKGNPVLSTKIEKIVRSAIIEGTKQTGSFHTRSLLLQPQE